MIKRLITAFVIAVALSGAAAIAASETFVGCFAEPADGGNLDTRLSTFDGKTVVVVPRGHPSEALDGEVRWRNVLFAIRGMRGKNPTFALPLTSPGSGESILAGNPISFHNIKLVWSYTAHSGTWHDFESTARLGDDPATWEIESSNDVPFTKDIVYVSINEHAPVEEFYGWLKADVFTHKFIRPTPSAIHPDSFVIGYQTGAPASDACSRAVPDMPLFGFVITDPAEHPTKLVMLVSGQHPYEGQNKVALRAAVDWVLNSQSAEAKAYRAEYLTIVYPFVNPTGEMAGLWRGTAYQPSRDTNRNWNTTETNPLRDRGIDTVIIHKNAMNKDIAALGLGEPYAMFDYHQNFGDRESQLDYVLHSSFATLRTSEGPRGPKAVEFRPYFTRLASRAAIASRTSDLGSPETLRGYMISRGVTLPITFERSVYNTLASEQNFGVKTVQALVDTGTGLERPVPVEAFIATTTDSKQTPNVAEGSVSH